jgi:hypothetical protein
MPPHVPISGGGWGVDDGDGAVDTALAVPSVRMVVYRCGSSDELAGACAGAWAGIRACASRA